MQPVVKKSKGLAKQYNLGPWLGGFKDLASRTMIYVSVLSFTQISATFWYTTLQPAISKDVPWLSFGLYFTTLVLGVLVIMFIEYKFILPSSYTFLNKQEYLHKNLIRQDIEEVMKEVGNLQEEVNKSKKTTSQDIKEVVKELTELRKELNESRNNSPNQ